MAILKNLIVNGASRFIGKTYFSDVDISGTASLSSLSLSGNLSVTGTSTFTGAATFSNTVNATGNITSSGNLYANGGYLYLQNKIAADGGETTANQLTINGSNAFTVGTYIKNNLKTDTLNATNVNVSNNLRANHYDLQTVAQLGGSFYVSPTVKFPNSGTTLAVAKSGTTLTLTITDSSITSATMAGVVWTAGSGVKVSGTINGVVTGTMDGTVSSINTSSHTLTLSVSGENSGNVQASPSGSPYTASQFSDLSVMVYQRRDGSNDFRVGIWMNCYDIANSSSTIRIYGGSDANPNVMLGNLTSAGLGTVNNLTPTGWGLFAQNAFLHGKVVANGGLIGNWTIGTTGMFYNSDAPGSTSITMIPGGTTASTTSIGGSSGSKSWIFTGKDLFGIDTTGKLYASSAVISGDITANTGYIGGTSGWTIASQQLSSGTFGADNSLFLATKNMGSNTSIAGRSGSDWRFTVGSKFGVTNTGALYTTSGKIGEINIGTSSVYSGSKNAYNSNNSGFYLGSDGKFGLGANNGQYLRWDGSNLQMNVSSLSIGGSSVATQSYVDTQEIVIIGTQTAITNAWTGTTDKISSLVNGQRIIYFLPYASASNVTLNITLSNGSTTGAINCYYGSTTRLGTQYGSGNFIRLIYRENAVFHTGTDGATTNTLTGWWADANYDSNTYDRTRYYVNILASQAIVKANLIVGDSSGYHHLKASSPNNTFDISYPILYANSNITVNKTGNDNYISIPFTVTTTQSITLTTHKAVYIKGSLSGSTFTPISTTPLTQTIPDNRDGYYYIYLGRAYSTTQIFLEPDHPIYVYDYNAFQRLDKIARNYLYYDANNGLVISQTGVVSTGYNTQITDSGMNIRNGSTTLASYGSSIILGELASGKTHVEIDSDSFDICSGAATGANSTKLATFGTDSVIGNTSIRCVSINSDGFKFNNGGKTAFYIGIDNRSGSTASEATGYTFPSNPEIKYINSIPYYLLTTISSDKTVIEVGIYAEMEDPEAESRIFFDWVVDDNKLYINCDEVDQKYDTAIDYVSYIYTTNTNTQASYCMIGDNAYSSSNPAGTMSFAQGYKCLALGAYSTSVGWETLASGTSSFSLGKRSEAHGAYSFAGGALSTSNDFVSFAYGYKSNAWGKHSVAFGNQDLNTRIFEILITSCDTEYGDITFRITQNAEIFEDYISTGSILVSTDNQYIFEDIVVTSGSGTSTITFSCILYGGHFPAVNSVLHVRVNPPGSYGNGAMSVNACCASGISSTALGIGTTAATGGSLAIGMYNIPESNVLFSIGNGTMLESHNAMTVDMFGNVKATKFQGEQKIIWSGASYMNASQTAQLTETVSSQANGIVLVWSAYGSGAAQNYDWFYYFVPKETVQHRNGQGVTMGLMCNASGSVVGTKYVYIYDTYIKGYSNNYWTGSGSGITMNNSHWVLRAVVGV